jgi:hypothetical protein
VVALVVLAKTPFTYRLNVYVVPSDKPVAEIDVTSGLACCVNGGIPPDAIVVLPLWQYQAMEELVVFHIDADSVTDDVVVDVTVRFPPVAEEPVHDETVIDPWPWENPDLFANTVAENDESDVNPVIEKTPAENVAFPLVDIV